MTPGDVFVYTLKYEKELLDYRIVLSPSTVLFLDAKYGDITAAGWWHHDDEYTKVEIND